MKDPIKDKERNIKLLLATISILLFIASIGVSIYDLYLENKSVTIKAQITSINYVNGKNQATVKYRLTGHEYETSISIKENKYSVDDTITIKVNMYNPTLEIINNHYYIYIPGIILSIVIMILSFPYLIKYYKRQNYIKELKKNNLFVNATITAVFINNNEKLKKSGQLPYRLRAKYFNPQTNSEYVFESEDTYVNINDPISEYQKTTVVVYLNQSDLNNYYVDLESLYPALNIVDPIAIMGPKTEIKFRFGTKAEQEYEAELKAKEEAESAKNASENSEGEETEQTK